jgi:hypothetical protein
VAPVKQCCHSNLSVKKVVSPLPFFVSLTMEKRALKNVNNSLNTNIYSYLETSVGQSYNLYLNVVHFFNTSVD